MVKKKAYYETTKKYSLDQDGNLVLGDKVVRKKKEKRKYKLWGDTKFVMEDLKFESETHADSVAKNWFVGPTVATHQSIIEWQSKWNDIDSGWKYIGNNYFAGPAQDYENYQPMTWQQQNAALAKAGHQNHGRLPETDKLPALKYKIKHPLTGKETRGCTCAYEKCNYRNQEWTLENIIIDLNDVHFWTREQIAEWLDQVSDPTGTTGPDIRFKTKENNNE